MAQLHRCPSCLAYLPIEEFRIIRPWYKRQRAKICELCEVEDRHAQIRARRKRLREVEEARREHWRNQVAD